MRRNNAETARGAEQQRTHERGFSVVELLIVLTLVGIAMIPLAGIQFGSRQQVTESERMSEATQIATSRIEAAKLAGFGSAAADTLSETPFVAVTRIVPDVTNPFLEEIEVTVSWSYGGRDRDIVMSAKRSAR